MLNDLVSLRIFLTECVCISISFQENIFTLISCLYFAQNLGLNRITYIFLKFWLMTSYLKKGWFSDNKIIFIELTNLLRLSVSNGYQKIHPILHFGSRDVIGRGIMISSLESPLSRFRNTPKMDIFKMPYLCQKIFFFDAVFFVGSEFWSTLRLCNKINR